MEFFLFCLRRICEAHTLVLLAVQFKNVRRASKETELKMFVVVLRGWLRPWWPNRQCIIQFHALFCENVNEIMVELDSLIITAHSRRAAVAAVAKKIEKKKKISSLLWQPLSFRLPQDHIPHRTLCHSRIHNFISFCIYLVTQSLLEPIHIDIYIQQYISLFPLHMNVCAGAIGGAFQRTLCRVRLNGYANNVIISFLANRHIAINLPSPPCNMRCLCRSHESFSLYSNTIRKHIHLSANIFCNASQIHRYICSRISDKQTTANE